MRAAAAASSLVALATLAACDAAQHSPTEVAPPPRLDVTIGPATTCNPSAVRSALADLYDGATFKSTALPLFNGAQQAQRQGNALAARAAYFAGIADLATRFEEDDLRSPSGENVTQNNVFFVMTSLLVCNGDGVPPQLAQLVTGIGEHGTNGPFRICVVLDVTQEFPCVALNGTVAVLLDPNFLSRQALVLIQPGEEETAEFEEAFGTTWSRTRRIRIWPIAAQVNLDVPDPPPGAPEAAVALCRLDRPFGTDFDHPTVGFLQLVHLAESPPPGEPPFTIFEEDNAAIPLLTEHCDVQAQELAAAPWVPASPLARDAWFAGGRVLDGLGRLLAPTPLHAFDGGIGGKGTSFRSYFAGTEKQALWLRTIDPTIGPIVAPLTLPAGQTLTIYGSRTAYGVVRAPFQLPCAFASSHPRTRVVALTDSSATVTAVRAGTATVSATCGTGTASFVVNTPR